MMRMRIWTQLQVVLSRVLAALVAVLVVGLEVHFVLGLEGSAGEPVTVYEVLLLVGSCLAVYGAVHKMLDEWINPADDCRPGEACEWRPGSSPLALHADGRREAPEPAEGARWRA